MYAYALAYVYVRAHVSNHMRVRVCLRPGMTACLHVGMHVCLRCCVFRGGLVHVSLLIHMRVSLPGLPRLSGTPQAYLSAPRKKN